MDSVQHQKVRLTSSPLTSHSPGIESQSIDLNTPTTNNTNTSEVTSPPISPLSSLPVYLVDHGLLREIYTTVQSCEGLVPSERMVLLGILPYLPLTTSNRMLNLRRILDLTEDQLWDLAYLLEAGIIAASSFLKFPRANTGPSVGSSKKSNKRHSDTPTEQFGPPFKRPKMASTAPTADNPDAISPNGPVPGPIPQGVSTRVLTALGIPLAFPVPVFTCFDDRQSLTFACLTRQSSTCPLTGHQHMPFAIETAHIIPPLIASPSNSCAAAPFWDLLAICFGSDVRDTIYRIISEAGSCISTNGLALDATARSLFDRGALRLMPCLKIPFDAETTHYYDVELCWRQQMTDLESLGTTIPLGEEKQLVLEWGKTEYDRGPLRSMKAREKFRLFTDRPAKYPLPHPLLLELHSVLWGMIGSTGNAEAEEEDVV